jgi:hypothetical protein
LINEKQGQKNHGSGLNRTGNVCMMDVPAKNRDHRKQMWTLLPSLISLNSNLRECEFKWTGKKKILTVVKWLGPELNRQCLHNGYSLSQYI